MRDRLVLTTKTFNPMEEGADSGLAAPGSAGSSRAACSGWASRRVDLYLAHEQDPETPLEETIGAFTELQQEGKLRAFGGSNVDAPWLEEALGHGRVDWVQNSYSLLERGDDDGVLEVCAREGLGYTPFSPLAGGWLTGKYRRGEPPPEGSRMTLRPGPYEHLRTDRTFDALEAFDEHARERGTSPAALALAWALSVPQVTAVVIGPRRPEQLQPALDALELELPRLEREIIGALFA